MVPERTPLRRHSRPLVHAVTLIVSACATLRDKLRGFKSFPGACELTQKLFVQRLSRRARSDAELVPQQCPQRVVELERLGAGACHESWLRLIIRR
jgi:hypothetical protein